MPNPVLVEVTRGAQVESRHSGAFAVIDVDGQVVASAGDIEQPIFPRSAIKAIQALPLVETGAADSLGFGDPELAIACASHNGEARHVETVSAMLAASGLSENDLECGAHPPRRAEDQAMLHRLGRPPGPVHNNCSGKHAGMLATVCHCGHGTRGYVAPDHWIQREIRSIVESVCQVPIPESLRGTDGCSVPTWAIPIRALALGFARFGNGIGLGPERGRAADRLRRAVTAEPFMVAGSGRFCTDLMVALGPKVFVKTGAEGVFCAAFPGQGLGVALKIDDGAGRAATVAMAALVARRLTLSREEEGRLEPWVRPTLRNWNGLHVGDVRPAGPL